MDAPGRREERVVPIEDDEQVRVALVEGAGRAAGIRFPPDLDEVLRQFARSLCLLERNAGTYVGINCFSSFFLFFARAC